MTLHKTLRAAAALAIALAALDAAAQRTCGSMEYLQQQIAEDPDRGEILQQIDQHANAWVAEHGAEERAVVTIPVVFHVVWRTAAENISDARIMAQLEQLNLDYALLNSNAGTIPSVFQGLAANTQVQFCLAQRDPSGAATTGIVRKQTTTTSWSSNDRVKYASYGGSNAWPRDSYLNIWVCNLGGGLLGYAQFPGGAAATDGVVVLYSSVGGMSSPGTASPYNLGRTLTHEVGHWLNLRHIWGDATCGNDQVADTPVHNAANYGCPAYPHYSTCSGSPIEMTMNYMDYTDDGCMSMFTAGQGARMQALFGTGGARASLLASMGCIAPGTACGTPAGLSASGITASSATVSWGAVSGATGYNLQYQASGAGSWTTVGASSASYALSGLSASTTYSYRVQAVCGGSSSAYSATSAFTTSGGPAACATPTGLAASGITASSAALSWNAVSGAASYNVQYKLSSSGTWSTGNVTSTSASLTGLTASTSYDIRVEAVCAASSSGYSSAITFTTSPAAACTDSWESNNTSGTAKAISVNTDIKGLISSSSDKDWFKFSNTSSARRIRIDLTGLPADYDVRLYRGTSTQVGISQNGGTANEAIVYNTSTVSTYYVQVYGYNGAYNASQCYTLRASISSSNFREGMPFGEEEAAEAELERAEGLLALYPNPASSELSIDYLGLAPGDVTVTVFDAMGREAFSTRQAVAEGLMTFGLPLPGLANGLYVLRIQDGERLYQQRFTIER